MADQLIEILESEDSLIPSVDVIKRHLRVEHDADDDDIEDLILEAVDFLERGTGRDFQSKKWKARSERFPCRLRNGVDAIESIKYYDSDNVLQTWDADLYTFMESEETPTTIIYLNHDFPTFACRADAVQVCYTTAGTLPKLAVRAIKLICGDWYLNREWSGEKVTPETQKAIDRVFRLLGVDYV